MQQAALNLVNRIIQFEPQVDRYTKDKDGTTPKYIIAGSLAPMLLAQASSIKYPNSQEVLINNEMRKDLFPMFRKIKDFDYVKLSDFNHHGLHDFLIDNLTCSIFYRNIIKKYNNISQKIDPIYFFKSQKN